MGELTRGQPARLARPSPIPYQQPSSAPFEATDAYRVARVLIQKKFQVLALALLVVIPAGIRTYLATPLYRSFALIEINPDPVQVLPYRDVADNRAGVYYDTYMTTQDQVLRSPVLANRVAARLLSAQPGSPLAAEATRLTERTAVRRIPNSQLFEISYLAPKPEAAARVVNLFAEEYVKQHFEKRQATREKARDSLKRELEVLEASLQSSEKQLQQYAQRENIVNSEPGQGALVERKLAVLDKQLADAEADRILARTKLETAEAASLTDFPDRLVTPLLSNLEARALQLDNELTGLRVTFGEKWPAVIAKRNELAAVREQQRRAKAAALDQARQQAQADYQAANRRVEMISESLGQQRELVNRLNNAAIQYNILRREVETNQKLYEGLLERLKQTSVLAGFEFGNIQVVEPGQPNGTVASPARVHDLGVASMLGLALGVCITLLLDFWDRSVTHVAQAEQVLGLPALGAVPLVRLPRSQRPAPNAPKTSSEIALFAADPPASVPVPAQPAVTLGFSVPPAMTEAVRNVCASILLSQTDRELRVILVTSTAPGEGKTTLACQMARALADGGARTLLVDADLRNATLSKTFATRSRDGLSVFLSGHLSPVPRIYSTDFENLSFIGAGLQAPNPVALLNSERMSSLLAQMSSKGGYRFVILDAPPVLAVPDARVLGAKVDGVLLVVRARRVASQLIVRARNLLEGSGANVLGVVLNAAGADDPDWQYYRRYYRN